MLFMVEKSYSYLKPKNILTMKDMKSMKFKTEDASVFLFLHGPSCSSWWKNLTLILNQKTF